MTALNMPPVAQIDNLFFSWPQRTLFQGWSARLPAGVTFVSGDESSGKTTLLRLLAGDLAADKGALQIAGVHLDQDAQAYRAQVFRTNPQTPLPQDVTPLVWLEQVGRQYPSFDATAVAVLIERLHLQEHQHKPIYMLSTGSRRKVWLVAAFASGAPLVLIDQPFAALDKASLMAVRELLHEAGRSDLQAWVVADYEIPAALALAQTITLD